MSEKFSGMSAQGAGETASSDFFTRLRSVSLDSNRRPVRATAAPSETLRSVCRPADESNFAKDFLKYRSKVQLILNQSVAGVQASTASRSGGKLRDFGASSSEIASASTNSELASASRTRSGDGDFSDEWNVSGLRDSNPGVLNPDLSNPGVSFQTPSFQSQTSQSQAFQASSFPGRSIETSSFPGASSSSSLPDSSFQTPLSQAPARRDSEQAIAESLPQVEAFGSGAPAENVAVEETSRKDRPIQFGNNPFAQLTAAPTKERAREKGKEKTNEKGQGRVAGNSKGGGWISSILSFGVLGLVSGAGLLSFSLNSSYGNHQLTALGISLLISGAAMFASVGLSQAFRLNSNALEAN